MQEEFVMLNLEVLSQRLCDRQFVRLLRRLKQPEYSGILRKWTTEQWQTFTDSFSPETQEQIVKQQHQIQAGRDQAQRGIMSPLRHFFRAFGEEP